MTDNSPGSGRSHNLDNFKRRAFELCLAVYRVTNLFPKGEVLAGQLRKSSSRIIVLLAQGRIRGTILLAEEIKIYLEIAKNQKWLAPINFDLLQSAYCLISDALSPLDRESERGEKIIETPPPPNSFFPDQSFGLSKIKKEKKERLVFGEAEHRQLKIADYFNKNKEAKVADLLNILGSISERTVRNDLSVLIGKNLIKKVGGRKDARYLLL